MLTALSCLFLVLPVEDCFGLLISHLVVELELSIGEFVKIVLIELPRTAVAVFAFVDSSFARG